jgi:RNase adapter protein RapZ
MRNNCCSRARPQRLRQTRSAAAAPEDGCDRHCRPLGRRRPRRGADHRHLGVRQVGGAARARGRRLLLRRQPAAGTAAHLLPLIDELKGEGVAIQSFFLDASTDALVRRFSETRRPHPLSGESGGGDEQRALIESIELERELLAELREVSAVIDTSQLRPAQLRLWLRQAVGAARAGLTLVFESFAFKHGVPLDADYVFDLRVLPNPHYIRELRPLSGCDAAVAAYLAAQPEVGEMLTQIEVFLSRWLDAFIDDQRSYLTVALGCTGGQHRSVYAAAHLAARFAARAPTLVRHRELDARG